jgi:hypothetical protein
MCSWRWVPNLGILCTSLAPALARELIRIIGLDWIFWSYEYMIYDLIWSGSRSMIGVDKAAHRTPIFFVWECCICIYFDNERVKWLICDRVVESDYKYFFLYDIWYEVDLDRRSELIKQCIGWVIFFVWECCICRYFDNKRVNLWSSGWEWL